MFINCSVQQAACTVMDHTLCETAACNPLATETKEPLVLWVNGAAHEWLKDSVQVARAKHTSAEHGSQPRFLIVLRCLPQRRPGARPPHRQSPLRAERLQAEGHACDPLQALRTCYGDLIRCQAGGVGVGLHHQAQGDGVDGAGQQAEEVLRDHACSREGFMGALDGSWQRELLCCCQARVTCRGTTAGIKRALLGKVNVSLCCCTLRVNHQASTSAGAMWMLQV